ncbi:hypothetical protein E3N88_36606 [Mikania micrantha]|uniref:Uncharacterized protein n=1 Tax=Mikania micrantha TaxID=192012 RepID=A0A5N6M569_9ASTR|nr:hypothetical protein E3N88_36606 [Mikania micrantha]
MGLEYWLQWQVLVCGLIFLLPALISIRFIVKNSNTPTTNSYDLWMPYWMNLHPIWLLIYRVFSFISMAYLLYQIVLRFGVFVDFLTGHDLLCVLAMPWELKTIDMLTDQSNKMAIILGTIISAHGCWKLFREHSISVPNQERDKFLKKDSSPVEDIMVKDNEPSIKLQMQFNQEAGFWGNLMLNIYQTCAGAVVLTDIVFWCLLLPFQTGDDFKLTLVSS